MKKHRLFVNPIILILVLILFAPALTAQEASSDGGFAMGLGLDLGVQTFPDELGGEKAYQRIGLVPDLSFGNFGLSLDLSFHVAPSEDPDKAFEFRRADWVPEGDTTFLELYLPKFNYIRYGHKGDPLYVKFGSIDDGTLGNGFIMGGYSNKLFLPSEKIFGMSFDLDGMLFGFPYVGLETFAGNLANFDVVGTRLFGRPLVWGDFPIVKNLEVGLTVAADLDPAYREAYFTALLDGVGDPIYTDPENQVESVVIFGLDFIQPILSNPVVSLAGFGDLVFQPEGVGGMLGVGGRLISFIPYAVQLRVLGENFIPVYFDATYDLYRAEKYLVASGEATVDSYVGWLASTGFSIMEDMISFNVLLDGPFKAIPSGDISQNSATEYPHLRAVFNVADGVLPGFFFNAYYDKKYIASFSDLVDREGAVIGATVNYKTGPAVVTLAYDVRYNPSTGEYDTSAKLMTSIGLF